MSVSPDITVSPVITVSPSVTVSPNVSVSPSASGGIVSLTISSPAVGTLFPRNVPITVSGTAVGSGDIYATFDGGSSVGTGTASGGTFTLEATALLADVAATELQIRRTSDDVVIGTLACVVVQAALWAPTATGVGAVTTSSGGVPADLSTWPNNLEVTVGGGNAVKVTTADSRHYVYVANPTNDIASYCDIDVSACVAQGSQVWVRVWAGTEWCNVNLSTGAQGNKSGATVTCTSGVVAFRSVIARDCRVEPLKPALGDDATATPATYVGNVADGFTGDVTFTQTRAAEVADQSGTGAHLVQATAADQPLYQASIALLAGLPVVYREPGRAGYLETTNATVLSVASGDDPAYAVLGIVSFDGNAAALCRWNGAGSILVIPLYRGGASLRSLRIDGTTTSEKTFGVLDASALASPQAVALIVNSDRSVELWIAGAGDTVTHDDTASAAMTSFTTSNINDPEREQQTADLLLLPGQVPGANAAARYAALRATLAAMSKLYNDVTPGTLVY